MQEKIERLRIKLLYEQSLMTQAAGLINIGVFALIIRNSVPRQAVYGWVAAGATLFLLRIVSQTYIRNRVIGGGDSFSPALWEKVFCISAMISGTYWAIPGTLLLSSDMVTFQTFLAFILAGVTAGATVAYSSSMAAVMSFTMPALIPFVISLSIEGDEVHTAMAAMIVLYTITISVVLVRVHSYIMSSIRLGFEKERLLERLSATQADSIRSQKMAALGMLAGGVAHEINTPLATINLKMEELAAAGDAQTKSIVRDVSQTVARIAKTVSALKSFARSNEKEPHVPVPISRVIADTVALCRGRFEGHGYSIVIQDGPKDCFFMGHAGQIGQALLNLMTNAFEALQGTSHGWVSVDVQADGRFIYLSVSDNGRGVHPDIRSKLMQPFFTTKGVGDGSGLGLSTALGIVKEHGGDLQLDEGSPGTKFVIALPQLPAVKATA